MLIYAQRVSSTVVNHLRTTFESDKVRILCIYCDHRESALQTPVNLIASLLKQLVEDGCPISDSLERLYRSRNNQNMRPNLEEISRTLKSELRGLERVFVVLDALDECNESNGCRRSLLAELRSLPGVNLMVTSRPHVVLEDPIGIIGRVDIRARDDDVSRFVDGRISRDDRLAKHVKEHSGLREDIKQTIVETARGM